MLYSTHESSGTAKLILSLATNIMITCSFVDLYTAISTSVLTCVYTSVSEKKDIPYQGATPVFSLDFFFTLMSSYYLQLKGLLFIQLCFLMWPLFRCTPGRSTWRLVGSRMASHRHGIGRVSSRGRWSPQSLSGHGSSSPVFPDERSVSLHVFYSHLELPSCHSISDPSCAVSDF